LFAAEARAAADRRELSDGTDAAQFAFELGVILAGTDIVSVLHDDLHAISRARTGRPRPPDRIDRLDTEPADANVDFRIPAATGTAASRPLAGNGE
jgi:hypothetical protein